MPVAITLAALLVASPSPGLVGPEIPAELTVTTSSADSLRSASDDVIASARAAYRASWAERQAGEYNDAIRIADEAIPRVAAVLTANLEAPVRRDLLDLLGKLTGVRDAATHDLEHPPGTAASAQAADRQLLNAPAIEDIDPQLNADVYRWIEFFTGNGRSTFERWLKRSGQYMGLFRSVLQREGLPPELVHLVFVESGFNVHARSVSAAVGPWQFLRSTGRLFGLTVNQWVDERKDPEKSTVAAARYLKHLYSIFGDWPLALASYNAGEGTVLRAIKRQGTTNYWDLRLPRQTEEYVPQFMAILAISREPQKYGFDSVELDEPVPFDELALKGSVDLRAIAKLADCTYEEMRYLNPAVLRHAAPGQDGVTTLRVPRGKGEVILSKLEAGATLPQADLTVQHRVKRGETLQGIANQYHVSAQQLAKSNKVSRTSPLKRGMVLMVRPASRPLAIAEIEPNDPRGSTSYVPTRNIRPPTSLNAESEAEGRTTVTVKRGETMAAIAERYGVKTSDITRWNRLTTTTVHRGQRLKVRTGDAAIVDAKSAAADSSRIAGLTPPSNRKSHHGSSKSSQNSSKAVVVVRPGQTLSGIAAAHGTTVARLRQLNGLSSNQVRSGQRIRIPA